VIAAHLGGPLDASRRSFMNKDDGLRSSQYWRERAAEARARAGEMRDKENEIIMRGIAAMYDEMADRAATREGEQN
jgi:hypothetical protein